MKVWLELRERIDDLKLTRLQREIANGLVEGRPKREIAQALGISEEQIVLCGAYLFYMAHRRPPGDAESAMIMRRPPIKPLSAGAALKLSS